MSAQAEGPEGDGSELLELRIHCQRLEAVNARLAAANEEMAEQMASQMEDQQQVGGHWHLGPRCSAAYLAPGLVWELQMIDADPRAVAGTQFAGQT